MKGKFIKAMTKDLQSDMVVSRFYYAMDVEDDTVISISLHQEDERIVGANLRKNMDAGFVILRNIGDEDEPDYEFTDYCPLSRDRDVTKEFTLEEGSYAVIPITTGSCVQKTLKASSEPINYKFVYENELRPHPYFLSALFDLFRKTDLAVNGLLSADELNQFGKIIDSDFFKKLTDDSLTNGELDDISCNEEGVSLLGFKQLLFRRFDMKEIKEIMTKMGYDDALNSIKSRVFMMNFQANEDVGEVDVVVKDALVENNMYQTAWNKLMQYLYEEEGMNGFSEEGDDHDIFGYDHPGAYAASFAFVNKVEDDMKVILDMTNSEGCLFSPNK